jgi:type VI secretion system secreted protein Hcp
MFLEFPNPATGGVKVTGESQDKNHPDTIEVRSISLGVQNATAIGSGSTGAGVGKAKFDALQVTRAVDVASPLLMKVLVTGAHFPEAVIYVRKADSDADYLVYQLATVFVTDLKWSADTGDDAPEETLQLTYGALQVTYTQQTTTGGSGSKVTTSWSQVTNSDAFVVS